MRLSSAEMEQQDEVGAVNIPDAHSFQYVLTASSLNILTSRRNQLTKTLDVVDLAGLKKVQMSSDDAGNMSYKGGMEPMGDFDEGKCVKLNFTSSYTQIICSVNHNKINSMMEQLFKISRSKFDKKAETVEKDLTYESTFSVDQKNFDMADYVKEELAGKHHTEIIDIGDWSVCDHVCGGGDQHKYKGCKPAIGGFKCNKKPLKMKRACNTQPCKSGENGGKLDIPDDAWKFKQPTITLPVSLDSRQISHRFQQQEECKIKDEDLCIRRQDLVYKLGMHTAPILPGRGVLNKKTFSFYENTKQDSLHRSYLLADIVVKPFALDSNCFEVRSKNDPRDTLVLCGCPFEASSKDAAITWSKEIQKFRDQCPENQGGSINVKDGDKLKLNYGNESVELSGDKLKELAKKTLDGKAKDEEMEAEEREQQKMSDAINQVESITTNYTKNEFFKERLMEKEEELKAKKELEKLDKMIQKEKEKEKCIQTFLEREGRRQARKQKEAQAEEELSEIKKEVQSQVKEIKHVFRSKMSKLAQQTERMKMEKMKQLTDMKLRITGLLIDQEIKGSVSNCKQDKAENKLAQCNARFPVQWFENKYCRMPENFCGVCCEKEFSVRFAEDRQKCIYECRLVNGMISSGGSEKLSGSNEQATVEIVNNP